MLKVDISDTFSTEQHQVVKAANMLSVKPHMCNFVQLITTTKYTKKLCLFKYVTTIKVTETNTTCMNLQLVLIHKNVHHKICFKKLLC